MAGLATTTTTEVSISMPNCVGVCSISTVHNLAGYATGRAKYLTNKKQNKQWKHKLYIKQNYLRIIEVLALSD